MFEIGLALALNCFILNLYYRNYVMAPWVRKLVLGKFARLVRVEVPECRTQQYIDRLNNSHSSHYGADKGHGISESSMNNDDNHNTVDSECGMSNGKKSDMTYFPSAILSREEVAETNKQNGGTSSEKVGRINITRRGKRRNKNLHRNKTIRNAEIIDDNLRAENTKLLCEDWKLVARIMDRVMLGAAVLIGVLSFGIIFIQAPRLQKDIFNL